MDFLKTTLSFLLGVVLSNLAIAAHPAYNEMIRRQVESDIEQFHLSDAETRLYQLPAAYRVFYQSNIVIYKWAASQDPAYIQQFYKSWDATLTMLQAMPNDNAHKKVFMAEMYGKRATLEFVKGDYVKAVMHGKECYNLIQENTARFPDDVANYKMQGLFNIALSTVPKKYVWITNSMGIKGNLEQGLKQLRIAASQGEVLRSEASFIAYYAEKNLMSRPAEAVQRLLDEQKRSGATVATDFFIATGYMVMNKNEKAYEILAKRSKYTSNTKVFFIPYWDYALAKSYYFKEDYKNSQVYFTNFLAHQKGTMYRTDGLFRLGMAYLLNGDYVTAKGHFQKLTTQKRSGFDEDEYAFQMASRFLKGEPSTNVQKLFRARNLFDGGYFVKSLAILEPMKANPNALTAEEKTEMYYRLGRVYHAQKNYEMARNYYTTCANQTQTQVLYMQVYSYYYLGEIARSLGQKEEARKQYKKSLTFDSYAYQNGLETRCKTAMGLL
ncbi:MAG: tetratricopeptide repeat protein [Bacteroidia bacterium]